MSIRVKGLIRLYNRIREILPQADQEHILLIESQVQTSLKHIEIALKQQSKTPQDLPRPSRQAYFYLKNLDYQSLGKGKESDRFQPKRTIRIQNLLRNYQVFMGRFAEEKELKILDSELKNLLEQAQNALKQVQASPLELAIPSQKAYASLLFFSENLEQALFLKEQICRLPWKKPLKKFYFIQGRFLWKYHCERHELLLNEGFLYLGERELQAIKSGFIDQDSQALTLLRQFAESEAFAQPLLELELSCGEKLHTQGLVFDLHLLFEELNQQYFEQKLLCPRLQFSRTLNCRKLGHYSATHDSIVISSSLDHAQVPPFVIQSVLYHEMLHKYLGVEYREGRRISHSPEFRRRERLYPHFEAAEEWLKNWNFSE
jgi:hypothetical protein